MSIVKINLSGHENEDLTAKGFTFPGALQVNLGDEDLIPKVFAWLDATIPLNSGDSVWVALPGLPILRDLVQVWVHGRTGQFPVAMHPERMSDGTFIFHECHLQNLRNTVARASRPNVIQL